MYIDAGYATGSEDGYSLVILSTGFTLIRIQCQCNLLKLCYACKFPGGARWNFNSDLTTHIILLHQEFQHAWAYGVSSSSLMLLTWSSSVRILVTATAHDLPSVSEVLRFREYGIIGIRYYRLCGLVIGVLGYRSGGPGSIPDTTRKKSSGSGTESTQPREYNWGATW
jgi:hypothetical protein